MGLSNIISSPLGQQFLNGLVDKVTQALGAGVPPQVVHDSLRGKAKQARNAEQRAALLHAAGVALDATGRDQAGLITQAGLNNKTFTPTFGAHGALGDGVAGVQQAEAQYQRDLGGIAEQEKTDAIDAAKLKEKQRIEQQRADAYAAQVAAQSAQVSKVDPQGRPKLSVNLEKQVGAFRDNIRNSEKAINSFKKVSNNISLYGGSEGLKGKGVEWVKSIFGSQDNASLWKTEWNRLRNSEIVNNLPPGIASDRDIALVKEGFPDSTWDKKTLKRWIDTYSKILKFDVASNSYTHDYLLENGGYPKIRDFYESDIYKQFTVDVGGVEEVINKDEVVLDFTVPASITTPRSKPGSRAGGNR